ncbi:hypothetical protein BKM20_06610 [Pseudomonas avellanae]|uniref:Uncharacterized protein n=1 Tax=Pseudomonas avellanae pv. morsprunorum TaxID=3380385 RepID=A0ABX4Z1H1_9PSED|nr:hypothetical protein AL055_12585 [Pseudomonas amygdali pv. morsprunorum]PHN38928.1 hypothetical protein AO261_14315 [Pseudomonas avellanae]POC96078.1 hypothetical protein BKM26_06100 [Pseudomonas avellanae]POD10353.1 hypothetical protein BKM20_06610 [Pseudomonas avellanae]POD28650.1 hypothetical protein BKM05_06840 [Pseudomonas avellanae]
MTPVVSTQQVSVFGRYRDVLPLTEQVLAHIQHPVTTQGGFVKPQIFPGTAFIDPSRGDRDMGVGMPVKPSAIGMDCTEHPDIQPSGSSPILQIVDGQAAQRIEQMTVMKKQWPQRVREREHQMLPGTIGQTVLLIGDPLIGSLFAVGRTSPAAAGVAQVFDVRAMLIATGVVFDAQDRGAAGQHFGDGFDFDVAQAALLEEVYPALVSGEQVFEGTGFVGWTHLKQRRWVSRLHDDQ